jgi:hypothetical protein
MKTLTTMLEWSAVAFVIYAAMTVAMPIQALAT